MDEFDFSADAVVSRSGNEVDDEQLAVSVKGESSNEEIKEKDKTHPKTEALIQAPNYLYENRSRLAKFLGLTDYEMDLMLLENDDVIAIAKSHVEKYVKPLAAQKAGARGRNVPMDKITSDLNALDDGQDQRFSNPSTKDMETWGPQEYLYRHVYQATQELARARIFAGENLSRAHRYDWGHLLLKCEETLHTNKRKMQQARSKLDKRRKTMVNAARRRAEQARSRATAAATYSQGGPLPRTAPTTPSRGSDASVDGRRQPAGATVIAQSRALAYPARASCLHLLWSLQYVFYSKACSNLFSPTRTMTEVTAMCVLLPRLALRRTEPVRSPWPHLHSMCSEAICRRLVFGRRRQRARSGLRAEAPHSDTAGCSRLHAGNRGQRTANIYSTEATLAHLQRHRAFVEERVGVDTWVNAYARRKSNPLV